MVLDGQRVGDERDWVLVGFFVTCSSSAEKRFIRPAKQDEMGLCAIAMRHARMTVANNPTRQRVESAVHSSFRWIDHCALAPKT